MRKKSITADYTDLAELVEADAASSAAAKPTAADHPLRECYPFQLIPVEQCESHWEEVAVESVVHPHSVISIDFASGGMMGVVGIARASESIWALQPTQTMTVPAVFAHVHRWTSCHSNPNLLCKKASVDVIVVMVEKW